MDDRKDTSPAGQHEFDTVVSGRVNLVNRWYVKVEGHFIDGAPTAGSAARGFYTLSNPGGILPTTNLLVGPHGDQFLIGQDCLGANKLCDKHILRFLSRWRSC